MKAIDRTGQIFNHLKLIKFIRTDNVNRFWEVECLLCNKIKVLPIIKVTSGHTKSCGCLQPSQRQSPKRFCEKMIFHQYILNAKKRGFEFTLMLEEFCSYLYLPCYYCGEITSNLCKIPDLPNHVLKYNGIDRLNSDKGYVKENIVPCCKICNRIKMNIPVKEFLNHVQKIVKYQINKEN